MEKDPGRQLSRMLLLKFHGQVEGMECCSIAKHPQMRKAHHMDCGATNIHGRG